MIRFAILIALFPLVFVNEGIAQFAEDTAQFTKYRFGGYGEILYKKMDYGADRYNYPDGSQPENRSTIGLPRAVFSFEYKFRSDIQLVSELEIEYGGTGTALELEYEESGEYEIELEKAGEIALEQLYLQKEFSPAFKINVGHIIVPIGRLNSYHLPTEFFTSSRPEGESQIIPSTWHETGIAVLGNIKNWAYEVQLVSGLDANGFSRANWVRSGYQRLFEESKATQMAGVLRIENRSLPSTLFSFSAYLGNSAKNTSKPGKMKDVKGTISILSGEIEFNNKRIIGRGSILYGNLSDSYEIGAINQTLSKNIQYPRTPVAQSALTYSFELGYDILTHFRSSEKLIPFVRYEYYNTMQQTSNGVLADERFNRKLITAGLNYYLLPGVGVKIDYSHRLIDNGNYNSENTLGIAVFYSSFFTMK